MRPLRCDVVPEGGRIHVAAAEDGHTGPPPERLAVAPSRLQAAGRGEGGDARRAARFDHQSRVIEDPPHGGDDLRIVHGHDLVDERLDVAEGDVARAHGQQAVGNAADAVERDGSPAGDRLIRAAPAGSTPMIRTDGARHLIAVDTPARRPPPLHGT